MHGGRRHSSASHGRDRRNRGLTSRRHPATHPRVGTVDRARKQPRERHLHRPRRPVPLGTGRPSAGKTAPSRPPRGSPPTMQASKGPGRPLEQAPCSRRREPKMKDSRHRSARHRGPREEDPAMMAHWKQWMEWPWRPQSSAEVCWTKPLRGAAQRRPAPLLMRPAARGRAPETRQPHRAVAGAGLTGVDVAGTVRRFVDLGGRGAGANRCQPRQSSIATQWPIF